MGIKLYPDDAIDIAERVECYENGKTFECDCGQGFGVFHDCKSDKCPTCGKVLYDSRWESREAPEVESGQTTLGDW
jgi:hypothetical protein